LLCREHLLRENKALRSVLEARLITSKTSTLGEDGRKISSADGVSGSLLHLNDCACCLQEVTNIHYIQGWPEPYIYTVYLVIFLPKIPYIHCIYMVRANPYYIHSNFLLSCTNRSVPSKIYVVAFLPVQGCNLSESFWFSFCSAFWCPELLLTSSCIC